MDLNQEPHLSHSESCANSCLEQPDSRGLFLNLMFVFHSLFVTMKDILQDVLGYLLPKTGSDNLNKSNGQY